MTKEMTSMTKEDTGHKDLEKEQLKRYLER